MQKRGKRGLSTIVITLIIILISLVAVGIIWVVVRNVIQTGTKEVTLGQFTLDAKIKDVNVYNLSNNVSLTIKRNPGVGEFSRMNFVFYDGKSSEVVTQPVSLNELEEKWFMFHLGTIDVDNLISISIFPYVKQDEKEILGNILDKYTVRGGGSSIILPVCVPATCASLGYECGTNWANGTNCAGALNCEPPNCITRYGAGYTCNSSGRCFFGTCTPLINNYCSVQGYECGYWGNLSCSGNLSCGTCGSQATCPSGTCVCNSGWGDCNNDNTCECNLASNYCSGGICVANPTGKIYYASPTGGGNGSSLLYPFLISNFWTVGQAGDTLYLLNGTYTGLNSMINPPDNFGGQLGNPITIRALSDGGVLIDGQFTYYTVYLSQNNYMIIEGINVNGSYGSNVNILSGSRGNIIRRVVSWDTNPAGDNNQVFLLGGAVDTLLEDVAGWGYGRKIFGLYYDNNTIIRRCFFRWTFHNSTTVIYKIGLTNGYYSINTTIENCIGTWDELPGTNQTEKNAIFGIDSYPPGSSITKLYGSIGYHLSTQAGSPSGIIGEWWENMTNFDIKDVIAYTDRTNKMNNFQLDDTTNLTASYLTSIGGTGGSWRQTSLWSGYPNQNVHHAIVYNSLANATNTGTYFDYVMYWNNSANYQGSAPANYVIQNPGLIASSGNILQYGLTEAQRPKVNGQSVGAQIQYRYINGVLTTQPLWPWPMNERIKSAMITSGYNTKRGLDGVGGTDLTKTIFELGGGTLPSF